MDGWIFVLWLNIKYQVMQKKISVENRLHTESFYSDNRCYFIDLLPTKINKLCLRLAIGHDKGDHMEYARIVLFEKDIKNFINAFCGVMHEYVAIKNRQR